LSGALITDVSMSMLDTSYNTQLAYGFTETTQMAFVPLLRGRENILEETKPDTK
jgi:hypothetical protein